jgi:hypothetical protein
MEENESEEKSQDTGEGNENTHPRSDLPENPGREPVDLNRRKQAMEMEKELGGVFGIGVQDIERALERLYSGEIPINDPTRVELPENIQAVIRHLDSIMAIAERSAVEDDGEALTAITELFENYGLKLEKMAEERGTEED